MKHDHYISELGGAKWDKRSWMAAFFISLIINAGLTAAILLKKEIIQTTFLPPEINQPFTFNNGTYSDSYVRQVSTWFLSQTLIYTPSSFEYQMTTFLKHVDPELFSKLRQTLLQEFGDIKKQRRSSIFFTQKIRVKGLSAVITGIRQIKIGNTDATIEQEHWYVNLVKRSDGLVSLLDFKKVSEADALAFLNN